MKRNSGNILIISGVDPTGEAGFSLDVVCVASEGFTPCGLPSSIVAENSKKVKGIIPTDENIFKESLNLIFEELEISATKIGLMPKKLIPVLTEAIQLNREKFGIIVLDPVFSASSGFSFHDNVDNDFLKLINLANVITPNAFEFERIYGVSPSGEIKGMNLKEGMFVVITGISKNQEIQLKIIGKDCVIQLTHEKLNREVRGTGCAFSSILTCRLALSEDIENAVRYSAEKTLRLVKTSLPLESGKYRIVFQRS